MKARQLRQNVQLRRVDRHVRAPRQQRRALALNMLLLHQKRHRRAARVQRPADDQRAFGHEQRVFRVSAVHQLVFRQPRVNIQLRRVKIGDLMNFHVFSSLFVRIAVL